MIGNLSSERRALIATMLRQRGSEHWQATDGASSIPRADQSQAIYASFAQQGLWLAHQASPDTATYNTALAFSLRGHLAKGALERALAEIVRRHEMLRTTFQEVDGMPCQRIEPQVHVTLPVQSMPGTDEATLHRCLREIADRPFDLEQWPLFRACLLELSSNHHVFVFVAHHIVCDGWSLAVFVRELRTLYDAFASGSLVALPNPSIQYADYAMWQRTRMRSEKALADLGYWKQALNGAPLRFDWGPAAGFDQPAVASTWSFAISKDLANQIRAFARQHRITPFMVLLAAWNVLLFHYTGQSDLIVGTPVSGRSHQVLNSLIGVFVNVLPLRTRLSPSMQLRELLECVRDTCAGAYCHQETPFESIVEAVRPARLWDVAPLCQIVLSYQDEPLRPFMLSGLESEEIRIPSQTALDLLVNVAAIGRCLRVEMSPGRFSPHPALLAQAGEHWEQILCSMCAAPNTQIQAALPATATSWSYPERVVPEVTVPALFRAQAALTPDAVAVVDGDRAITYRELEHRADRLALVLRGLGVGPEVRVGICTERCLEMVVGLLGIFKAGGVQVPLDPEYPADRLAYMISDASIQILLTLERLASSIACSSPVVFLDGTWDSTVSDSTGLPDATLFGHNLAYIIYTSGSTGRPKGAMVSHRSLSNHMLWMQDAYPLTGGDIVLQKTPFSFDASVWEFWAPLLAGARLVLAQPGGHRDSQYLTEVLASQQVTILQLVPAQLAMLLQEPAFGRRGALRWVFCGGEVLIAGLVEGLRERLPEVDVVNLYGPAETCIQVVTWICERTLPSGPVAIGTPVWNARVHILDPSLRPLPAGLIGELFIGGVPLGRGYLYLPGLTAERFLPDPLACNPGERLYRTGDLARRRLDGVIDFVGRVDGQVKLRGFRIELGEVEAAITRHPAVSKAVVMLRGGQGDERLMAWVAQQAGASLTTSALRATVAARLPDYMVPSIFVILDALPLTPNGKLDRQALPEPEVSTANLVAAGAPRTPVAEIVGSIVAELLGVDRVDMHENFFQLGGHSLLATRLMSRLRQHLGVDMPLRVIFESATLADLAAKAELARLGDVSGPVTVLGRDGVLPLSFGQERLLFLHQLEPDSSAYNAATALHIKGSMSLPALESCFSELLRRHEPLRTSFSSAGGEPIQIIAASAHLDVPLVDLRGLQQTTRETQAKLLIKRLAWRPFDLTRSPLLRLAVMLLDQLEASVVAVSHHIVGDAWSMGILAGELGALYRSFAVGEPSPLKALPMQYADYANWQRQRLQGEVLERQLSYWRRQLAAAPNLVIPAIRRPPAREQEGAIYPVAIDVKVSHAIAKLARKEDATLFMVLLAAFQCLLCHLSKQEDLTVGSPISNRGRVEFEGLVGFFVNTIVLRADLSGDPTFQELIGRVRKTALEAYAHQDLPFERLVADLRASGDLTLFPLFRAWFVLHNTPAPIIELPGLTINQAEIDIGEARHDLKLDLTKTTDGLCGFLHYRCELFDEVSVASLCRGFELLLQRVSQAPQTRLSELLQLLDHSEEENHAHLAHAFHVARGRELRLLAGKKTLRYLKKPGTGAAETRVGEGKDYVENSG